MHLKEKERKNSSRGTSVIGLGLGSIRIRERNFVMQVSMYFLTFSVR